MAAVIADIDHLLTYVSSLEAAVRTYERLGFTLTPISDISAMGIANRLALMRSSNPRGASFIELMTVTDQAKLPPRMRPFLTGEEGVKCMVLLTLDAHAAYVSLAARGYAVEPPAHVKREWILSPGQSVWPEFDVLLPIPAPLAFNACQYHNVELYHHLAWTEHVNTAHFVSAVYAVASNVAATGAYYEQLFEVPLRHKADGSVSVTPGQTELRIYSPQAFATAFDQTPPPLLNAARYVGYEIEVRDLVSCRRVLEENGVAHRALKTRLTVPPLATNGNLVVFAQHDA